MPLPIDRRTFIGTAVMGGAALGLAGLEGAPAVPMVDYVWSLPISTVIIGCDSVNQLEQNIALAREFRPLDDDARLALETRTKAAALQCSWYKRESVEPWG